jgi:hypothetical protein
MKRRGKNATRMTHELSTDTMHKLNLRASNLLFFSIFILLVL